MVNRIKRISEPVLRLLRQGASPNRLAASFALGAVIGLFPVVGVTTAICTVVAILFRFNFPIIQLGNYMAYPLQLALLIPFAHLGAALFQAPPPPFTAEELAALFTEDFWGTLASFSTVIAHAVAAWAAAALPLYAGMFLGLSFIFKGIARRRAAGDPSDRHPVSAN
jgi:uncharacterized protein (DUF2062 family)